MATMGLVTPLSVFTYNNEKVIGGIPWEFIERLEKMGGCIIEKPLGNVAFDPELYKLLCRRGYVYALLLKRLSGKRRQNILYPL